MNKTNINVVDEISFLIRLFFVKWKWLHIPYGDIVILYSVHTICHHHLSNSKKKKVISCSNSKINFRHMNVRTYTKMLKGQTIRTKKNSMEIILKIINNTEYMYIKLYFKTNCLLSNIWYSKLPLKAQFANKT